MTWATFRRQFGQLLVGLLLLQAAWILTLPPYGGIDEHEHAFKAAAVARGDFSPHHVPSSQGWGEFLEVPSSIVEAARPECLLLEYTHSDNCIGSATHDGRVRIASSAARYNPAYYAVIGTAARPFGGTAALYVMRGLTALICAVLISTALIVVRSWSRTPWPPLVALLALTPTALYSTTVVAPNGVEICGGALLWACLLGVGSDRPARLRPGVLLLLAAVASVPLLSVRTLGPLWWVLVVSGGLLTIGAARARRLLHHREAHIFAAVSAVAGIYGFGWAAIARSNGFVTEAPNDGSPWPDMPSQWLLWFFQTIAAAPRRNEYVPIVVYAIALSVMSLVTVAAVASATPRIRAVMLYIVVSASATGIGASAVAFEASGYAWQGRYFYPFTVGFFFIVGLALDRCPSRFSIDARFTAAVIGASVGVTELVSQIAVRDRGVRTSPLAESGTWLVPSTATLAALTLSGTVLLVAWAIGRWSDHAQSSPSQRAEALSATRR